MNRALRQLCAFGAAALVAWPAMRAATAQPVADAAELAQRFATEVDRRLDVPADDRRNYVRRMDAAKGEVVLEQRRPDLPAPGKSFRMDLSGIGRPAGWIVVAAIRVGNVVGAPSEPAPWLDPAL